MARERVFMKAFLLLSALMTMFLSETGIGRSQQLQKKASVLNMGLDLDSISLKPFYLGYYGKVGSSSLFIAPRKTIPDMAGLYKAVVQVLSKKYGCMMRKKINKKPYLSFLCKDQRIVVFHTRMQGKYILFSGRQFDRDGREIIVKNRQIVGRYPMFERRFPTQR
jgi:hypothetical protein